MRGLVMIGVLALLLSACETMNVPWDRGGDDLPPVELLEEEGTVSSVPLDAPSGTVVDGIESMPKPRFSDVPLPKGLREDVERTYVFENANLQIGRMVYYTKSEVNALAQFYISECERKGWKLDSVLQAEGAQLFFSKPGKRLDVMIRSQGVSRSNLLVVSLTPTE